MKRTIKIFDSFQKADEDFFRETSKQSPDERVSDVEFCRRQYFKVKGIPEDTHVKRIFRVGSLKK
jgi:hypothetical protein